MSQGDRLVEIFIIMTIKVDKEKCLGCGACVSIAPAVFRMEEDGKSGVIEADNGANLDSANQAKDACPVQAIEIN